MAMATTDWARKALFFCGRWAVDPFQELDSTLFSLIPNLLPIPDFLMDSDRSEIKGDGSAGMRKPHSARFHAE
jgi:hypothetical protein